MNWVIWVPWRPDVSCIFLFDTSHFEGNISYSRRLCSHVVNLSVRDMAQIHWIRMAFRYQFQGPIFATRLTDDNDKCWLMNCGSTRKCGFYTWFFASCGCRRCHWRFRGTLCLHSQGLRWVAGFSPAWCRVQDKRDSVLRGPRSALTTGAPTRSSKVSILPPWVCWTIYTWILTKPIDCDLQYWGSTCLRNVRIQKIQRPIKQWTIMQDQNL
jgi:hypothetical protein